MEHRRVNLLVGRKSYNLVTSLDDDKLREVYDLLRDAVAETDPAMEQDERLFLACMRLASEMVSVSSRVEKVVKSYCDPAAKNPQADTAAPGKS